MRLLCRTREERAARHVDRIFFAKHVYALTRSPCRMIPHRPRHEWIMVAGNHVHESTKSCQDVYDLLHEYAFNTVVLECIPADDDETTAPASRPVSITRRAASNLASRTRTPAAPTCAGSHTDLPICRVEELHDSRGPRILTSGRPSVARPAAPLAVLRA